MQGNGWGPPPPGWGNQGPPPGWAPPQQGGPQGGPGGAGPAAPPPVEKKPPLFMNWAGGMGFAAGAILTETTLVCLLFDYPELPQGLTPLYGILIFAVGLLAFESRFGKQGQQWFEAGQRNYGMKILLYAGASVPCFFQLPTMFGGGVLATSALFFAWAYNRNEALPPPKEKK